MSAAAHEHEDEELRLLLEAIYSRFHYDFRHYARASIRRRVGLASVHLQCDGPAALRARLEREPDTFSKVLQFLTVQVSDMFRDPCFYRVMREHVAPVLKTYPSVKVWCAGCSTGEEVYSLAVLLHEEGLLERTLIYATDINPEALNQAEAGVYSLERIPAFTENHRASGGSRSLSEYYIAKYGGAVFDRSLRKHIVFSDHSLATDNVFAEVHVVSCRNVLIYFDRELQDRAIGIMKDSLVRRGFLGLGAKETLDWSTHAHAFELCVKGETWHRRVQ